MGINLITALIIQNNPEVYCEAGGPVEEGPEKGKYVGWIMLERGKWHPLLNTEPIFSTKEEALAAMEQTVADIKALDLSKETAEIKSHISPEHQKVIGEVIALSKEGG